MSDEERAAMVAEIERLKAALKTYGAHVDMCSWGEDERGFRYICRCGLDDLLEGNSDKESLSPAPAGPGAAGDDLSTAGAPTLPLAE